MGVEVEEPFALGCLKAETSQVWVGEHGIQVEASELGRRRAFLGDRNDCTRGRGEEVAFLVLYQKREISLTLSYSREGI